MTSGDLYLLAQKTPLHAILRAAGEYFEYVSAFHFWASVLERDMYLCYSIPLQNSRTRKFVLFCNSTFRLVFRFETPA